MGRTLECVPAGWEKRKGVSGMRAFGLTAYRTQWGVLKTVAVALVITLVTAGCFGAGGGDEGDGATGGAETSEGPVELTFWSWVPDLQKEVDLFEEAHPNIAVKLVNAGTGADEYTKLRTALKAGSGAPDVVQVEFQFIPTFRQIDGLVDLSQYGANEVKDDYADWAWDQVSEGDSVYAIPQDSGPMGLLYRKDIFEKYNLEVPTTWDEFAAEAEKLHKANPDIFMTDFPPSDPGWFTGLLWQNGVRPFEVDGTNVSVSLDDPAVLQVTEFWGDLIDAGLVDTTPDFTNEWYSGLSEGKYASWVSAAWGPVFLQGIAGKTSGKWRVAPLPQWEEGEEVTANWGGSTDAVTTQSDNPEEAAELAIWLNHDPESVAMLNETSFLFPVLESHLESDDFKTKQYPFYGGQEVNEVFIESSNNVDTGFEWSPFQDYVYSQMSTHLSAAIKGEMSYTEAIEDLQSTVAKYAEDQGFTLQQ